MAKLTIPDEDVPLVQDALERAWEGNRYVGGLAQPNSRQRREANDRARRLSNLITQLTKAA